MRIGDCRLEKLRGMDVAKGVGGEVADPAHGPVNVLQAAMGIVCGREAEGLAE